MEDGEYRDSLRLSEARRRSLLRRMDSAARDPGGRVRRRHDRYTFRQSELPILIVHPAGSIGKFLICTRNLSNAGMSFLHGGFLHKETEVRALLANLEGGVVVAVGRVASCRYVSHRVHEVGVEFDERLDVERFCPPGAVISERDAERTSVRIPQMSGLALCVCSEPGERRRLARWLTGAGINAVESDCLGSGLDTVKRLPLDVVIFDGMMPETTAAESSIALRRAGFRGMLIVALPADAEELSGLEPVDARIALPFSSEEVYGLLPGLLGALGTGDGESAIFSSLAGEAGIADLLEGYVREARAASVRLKAAVAAGDAEGASGVCRALGSTAGGYGFAALRESATAALRSLEKSGDLASAKMRLELVMSICSRLHAGAGPRGEEGAGEEEAA